MIEKIPLIILAILFSIITYRAEMGFTDVSVYGTLPAAVRFGNVFVAYVLYVTKMFWPVNLAVYYAHPGQWPWWTIAGSIFFMAAISSAAFFYVRRAPYFFTGWFWYVGTLIPVIGFVQIGYFAMADRYTYVPLIGLFVIVSWGGFDYVKKYPCIKKALVLAGTVVILLCAAASFFQVRYWQNSVTLFEKAVRVDPANALAHNNLAMGLVREGRMKEAEDHYIMALKLEPDAAEIHNNLGVLFAHRGNGEAAVREFSEAVRLNPSLSGACSNLGLWLVRLNRYDEALRFLREAIGRDPHNGNGYNLMGVALAGQGRYEEAAECFRRVVEIDPDYLEGHTNLGIMMCKTGKSEEAVRCFLKALQLNPEYGPARQNLEKLYEVPVPPSTQGQN